MNKPTLVIMAAGMGSRFGGCKQITPVDSDGHLIIDYSIFDAVRAGFGSVVCVIKPEMEADFRAAIGDRISRRVDLKYAYQTLDRLPAGYSIPEFTRLQNERFERAIRIVRAAGYQPIAHAAASSAMLNPEYQHDMVRAGVALYGGGMPEVPELKFAQTLISTPIRMETIEPGDTVGYGRTFTASRKTRVMTIPIGYGDGYPRLLGNRAEVLIRGKRAPVIGNVCMDMLMADVTDIPEAQMGDSVVLMGAQGDDRITPDELAEKAGTIGYEIMLGYSARVPRVYADEREER